ncbi:hypothetical protein CupriaWKF_27980 [Cupriavidus sp. WKF15]|uniref:hypothetical protein n=1 Tax=Cupriavidus sp. WKF15 TaxID=3032282 RepID=UPI0023E2AC15|nr:hypothetical protein [Cupriavidus sp. WKF15]WER48613.1 hypothetical protein CupriaWKF_27980 [Cupriavidus sp. WKF15]
MHTPLPPNWENLYWWALHNPFGGDPRHQGPYTTMLAREEPVPVPWRATQPEPNSWSPAAAFLISAIGLNQVARQMPEGPTRSDLTKSTDRAIREFIDGCGTRVPGFHWPWPGPNPSIQALVSELGIAAQGFDGTMREEILQVAGRIVQESFGSEANG